MIPNYKPIASGGIREAHFCPNVSLPLHGSPGKNLCYRYVFRLLISQLIIDFNFQSMGNLHGPNSLVHSRIKYDAIEVINFLTIYNILLFLFSG